MSGKLFYLDLRAGEWRPVISLPEGWRVQPVISLPEGWRVENCSISTRGLESGELFYLCLLAGDCTIHTCRLESGELFYLYLRAGLESGELFYLCRRAGELRTVISLPEGWIMASCSWIPSHCQLSWAGVAVRIPSSSCRSAQRGRR